mmetsp:Transcript_51042/g.101561  ORF Transcript_51042/g.101561 Transcript_51042/m.101561 type:complete len:218 (+) Transcript_51042:291-944(+)
MQALGEIGKALDTLAALGEVLVALVEGEGGIGEVVIAHREPRQCHLRGGRDRGPAFAAAATGTPQPREGRVGREGRGKREGRVGREALTHTAHEVIGASVFRKKHIHRGCRRSRRDVVSHGPSFLIGQMESGHSERAHEAERRFGMRYLTEDFGRICPSKEHHRGSTPRVTVHERSHVVDLAAEDDPARISGGVPRHHEAAPVMRPRHRQPTVECPP